MLKEYYLEYNELTLSVAVVEMKGSETKKPCSKTGNYVGTSM